MLLYILRLLLVELVDLAAVGAPLPVSELPGVRRPLPVPELPHPVRGRPLPRPELPRRVGPLARPELPQVVRRPLLPVPELPVSRRGRALSRPELPVGAGRRALPRPELPVGTRALAIAELPGVGRPLSVAELPEVVTPLAVPELPARLSLASPELPFLAPAWAVEPLLGLEDQGEVVLKVVGQGGGEDVEIVVDIFFVCGSEIGWKMRRRDAKLHHCVLVLAVLKNDFVVHIHLLFIAMCTILNSG